MTAINRILIVDDEDNVRRMLSTAFALQGFETHCANNGRTALHLFADIHPDVVLMDIRMPEMDGIKALKEMRSHETRTPVILMTAYAEVETAVEALRCGAFDYVIKPFDLDELNLIVQRALQLQSMKKEIRHLHQALSTSWQWGHILTNSPAMMDICKDTAKIALSQASVLISGESGTGKELIARAIHYNSRRAKGPFIKVNCAALPESLLESELFGHEKGAFTGAQTLRQGLFERANEGTLLLDEIGEMPLVLQAKLLRILQEREFERIGGHQTIKVDIRIIAATNRDLQAMVKEGTFREDLFYRLNVIHLILPPLRDRREDISLLANHFLQKFSSENQRDIIDIDPMAMSLLTAWSWPGNIRELSNVIERAVVMNSGPIIFSEDLPPQIRQPVCNAGEVKTAPVGERNLKEEIVDSIGQRNSYVKTWGCGGFLNETNIYSRGKSLVFELWKNGTGFSEIANILGSKPGTIFTMLRDTGGIKPHERKRAVAHLTLSEREEIRAGLSAKMSIRAIATALNRSPSTISREVQRNRGRRYYKAVDANNRANRMAKRPKPCLLDQNLPLRKLVLEKLEMKWSPEQISGWLRRTKPTSQNAANIT